MKSPRALPCTSLVFLSGCCLALGLLWPQSATSQPPQPTAASATTAASAATAAEAQLKQLFADGWAFTMRDNPIFASMLGVKRYNHKLPNVSLAAQRHRLMVFRGLFARLGQVSRAALSLDSKRNYDLYQRKIKADIQALEHKTYLIPITNRTGFHIEFADLPRRLSLKSAEDHLSYIFRLKAFLAYTKQHIALLEEGRKRGFTLPAVVLKGYAGTIRPHVVKSAAKSLLYRPFQKRPKGTNIDAAAWKRLQALAQKTIMRYVVPGYQTFLTYMTKTYIPKARRTIAASAMPQGRRYYAYYVRHYTTLPLTPAQVHQTGLREVKRIRAEMQQVIEQTKFKGSFADFLKFLRTDPRFYAKTPKQLLQVVSYTLKRMDGALPKLFRKLPRMSYGIREIPAYIAPKTSTAYYLPPSGDGRRAGFYYVNTHNLKSRPLYEVQALSFHEAVPGHHLQIALQQERKNVPNFRRFYRAMAFQEGWGLYAERLGLEVGFYRDPYNNFGRLTYEMWRACRLVVDTGIHWYGWSRKRAIDYMAKHTALSLHNVTAEIDRYISWPGQALAYKIGELKIRALRKRAEKALGKRFDLRAFHDALLAQGAIPLDLLDLEVQRFIQANQTPTRRPGKRPASRPAVRK